MTDMSNWNDDAVWWGSKARQDAADTYVKWAKDALKDLRFDGAFCESMDHGNELLIGVEKQEKKHSNRFKIHRNVVADVYRWARDL